MTSCLSFFRRRVLRAWRVGLTLAIGMAALLLGVGAKSQGIESVVAPGKLIQGHVKWEDDCKQCHVKFDRKGQDRLCMDCHKEIGADVRASSGFHGKKVQQQACRVCHTEHKGREGRIVVLDQKQFDHTLTNYALQGKHQKAECVKCHLAGKKFRAAAHECNGCHKKDDVHKGELGTKCESCHKESSWKEAKFDHDTARFPLTGKHPDVKCAECHKNTNYRETPRNCFGCHQKIDDQKGHKGQFGEKCESCHGTKLWKGSTFNHDADTKYLLRGKHGTAKCVSCHTGKLYAVVKLGKECYACHQKDDKHKDSLGKNCGNCHTEKNWKESPKFDHATSIFPLLGKHAKTECKECHKGPMFKEAPKDCLGCHKKDDKHNSTLGEKCADCHTEIQWKTTDGRFNHDRTKFVLRNAHARTGVKCVACHKDLSSFRKTPLDCLNCHKKDDKHEGQEGPQCEKCHSDRDWKVPQFDHGLTRFPLLGKHVPVKCEKCHASTRFKDAKVACVACHVKDDKHKKTLGPDCAQCHNARSWKDWSYDHDLRTKFVLDGKHKSTACARCHTTPTEQRAQVSAQCISCHSRDDVHEGSFGRQCQQCHLASAFKTLKQKTGRQDGTAGSRSIVVPMENSIRLSELIPR